MELRHWSTARLQGGAWRSAVTLKECKRRDISCHVHFIAPSVLFDLPPFLDIALYV